IAAHYGYSLSIYPGVAHFYVGGETEDADALRDRFTEALVAARDRGVDPDRFEEARKREIGRLLAVMDDPDYLVGTYVIHRFQGIDLLRRRELLDDVRPEDGAEFLEAFVQDGRRVFSVAEPL